MYRTTPKQIYKILQENRQITGVATNVLRRKVMRFIVDNMAKDENEKVEDKQAETKTEKAVEKSEKVENTSEKTAETKSEKKSETKKSK